MTDVRRDSAEAGEVKTEYNFKHGGTENTEEYKKNEIQMSALYYPLQGGGGAECNEAGEVKNRKLQTANNKQKTENVKDHKP